MIVSSVTLLACRDTLAAGRKVQLSGRHPVAPGDSDSTVLHCRRPSDVRCTEWTALPAAVTALEPEHLPALHADALAEAWRDGAWDLHVSFQPPLVGPELGLVSAFADFSGAPDWLELALLRAAGAGRLVRWCWRPQRGGPDIRKRQRRPDVTLGPDFGRAGPPPARPEPVWRWRKPRSWTIRLGAHVEAEPAGAPEHRATPRQRAYIVALRQRTGREVGEPLPAALSVSEASAMIERLSAS